MILVYFRGDLAGTVTAQEDGNLVVAGPQAGQVERLVTFYARASGLQGEPLLRLLLARLRGNWWAKEGGDDGPGT